MIHIPVLNMLRIGFPFFHEFTNYSAPNGGA